RLHPFIAVWDDHESANDAWSGGAVNHDPSKGSWTERLAGADRAHLAWVGVREAKDTGIHLYRSFRFGDLADVIMLDTRGLRDQQALGTDPKALADPARSPLRAAQETWVFDHLRAAERHRRRGSSISGARRSGRARTGASSGNRFCSRRSRRRDCRWPTPISG